MNALFKLSLIPSAVGGLLLAYKSYYGVPMYEEEVDLKDKVAIVTGASSGIGQEIAYQLAKRNATVVIACRNMSDCKSKRTKIYGKTKNENIYCSELDLNSLDSVKQFVKRLSKKISQIDIVVNNAGIKSGALRQVSSDNIEQQLAVNVMAPYLLNKLILPLLSKDARVVSLVCPQYSRGKVQKDDINFDKIYNRDDAFAQSQLMRTITSYYLSQSTRNVCYITCDPGPTNSNFHINEAYNGNIVSRNIFKSINLFLLRNIWQASSTPLMCCCSESVKSGFHYKDLKSVPLDPVALSGETTLYVNALCNKWTSRFHTLNANELGE